MAVPILQTVVGIILVLLGIDTAKNPPTTRNMLWFYRLMFVFLAAIFVALSWIEYRDFQRKEADAVEKIRASAQPSVAMAPTPATAAPAPTPAPVIKYIPDPKQVDYQKKYEALLDELSTNGSLDPNLREQLIVRRARLTRNDGTATPQVPAADMSAATAARGRLLPFFEYGVKTLAALSDEEGRLKSDRSISTYRGLPADLSAEAQAGKSYRYSPGEIHFEKKADWDFKIDFAETALPRYEASLSVTCMGGVLLLKSSGSKIEAKVQTSRGESFVESPTSGSDARGNIAEAVGKLVAAGLEATGGGSR